MENAEALKQAYKLSPLIQSQVGKEGAPPTQKDLEDDFGEKANNELIKLEDKLRDHDTNNTVKPTSEEAFSALKNDVGAADPELSGFLNVNSDLIISTLVAMGYPSPEKKAAGEGDKEQMKDEIQKMDLTALLDDSDSWTSLESFWKAVGTHLEGKQLLKGDWFEQWQAGMTQAQVGNLLGDQGMFEGLYTVVEGKFKEGQEIRKEQEMIKGNFKKWLDPDNSDSFLSDDYLRKHSIEKKLASGEYAKNDGSGLMARVFKDNNIDPKIQDYLGAKMGTEFGNFCKDLQSGYDKKLAKTQKKFDTLFDDKFKQVREWDSDWDPDEESELRKMIYTSAKETRSLNDLNDWYKDDVTRFDKYADCVNKRIAIEKEMWDPNNEYGLAATGDKQLGHEHDQLRAQYQQQRKRWGGGAYYSPGDQWVLIDNFYKNKVKPRARQLKQENEAEKNSIVSTFEGGAFGWGEKEKLGDRMGKYVDGLLKAEPKLLMVEQQDLLRNLRTKLPTLKSQMGDLYKSWEDVVKEVGEENIDPAMLAKRDTMWKGLLGKLMPRSKGEFTVEKWNISEQAAGMRALTGEIRKENVNKMGEDEVKKDIEEKIKKGDLKDLTVGEHDLLKPEAFEKELLKSWGYSKSQFKAVVGNDKFQSVLGKLHKQWSKDYDDHWQNVFDKQQVTSINQRLDSLPGQWSAVGSHFLTGMRRFAGPDKPWKVRTEWLQKNSAKIDETIRAMDSYVTEYDKLMTKEFKDFVHSDQPALGQELNSVWSELTGQIAAGNFSKLGVGLGGYDVKTRNLYAKCQVEQQLHLQEKESEAQLKIDEEAQEKADKKLETEFKAGTASLDKRFPMFLRRHKSMRPGAATGAAGSNQNPFKNEAELKSAVLKGMIGMNVHEDKAYFDEWIKEKFKRLKEGTVDDEESPLQGMGILNSKMDMKRKEFEESGYVIDNERHLQLLDKFNIRPDYLQRTGLSLDKLTKGLERMEQMAGESGKVGYLSQMMTESSLNSTGVFGTMIIGMMSVMNSNDYDTWRSDVRKMDFKMGKPGKEDAVLLMNSLFTNDRLMSQVNKDLSDLRSRFVSQGLKLINIDLKDILKDNEAMALEEIMKEIEEAEEKEREANTPEGEVSGHFEMNGIAADEYAEVMQQLSEYRFDPKVSSKGLSAQHLENGLDRIKILQSVEAFGPLDKILKEGTQNGYLTNHLFESLAIVSDAEFAQWERQVRGMNLDGMSDEEKSYAMLQILFDQGTLDRIATLEGVEQGVIDTALDGEIEEGAEGRSGGAGEDSEGERVSGLEGAEGWSGGDTESIGEGDETEVGVGHEFVLDESGEASAKPDGEGVGDRFNGLEATETQGVGGENVYDVEGTDTMTDEAIDALADGGDGLLEDAAIDAQADKGDELLEVEEDQLQRVDGDDGDEVVEEDLDEGEETQRAEGAEQMETVTVESGVDVGAQAVTEGSEVDGGTIRDSVSELPSNRVGEILDAEDDVALLEEQPYATAEDFAEGDDDEVAEGKRNEGAKELVAEQGEDDEEIEENLDNAQKDLSDRMGEMSSDDFEKALMELGLDEDQTNALREQKSEMDADREQELVQEQEKLEGEEREELYDVLEGKLGEMTGEELEDALKNSELDDESQAVLREQKTQIDAKALEDSEQEQEVESAKEMDDVYGTLESQLGEMPADEFESALKDSGLDDEAQTALREQKSEMDAKATEAADKEQEAEDAKEMDDAYAQLESQLSDLPADEFESVLKDSDLDEKSQETLWKQKTELDMKAEESAEQEQAELDAKAVDEFREDLESKMDDMTAEDLDEAMKDSVLDDKAQEELRTQKSERMEESMDDNQKVDSVDGDESEVDAAMKEEILQAEDADAEIAKLEDQELKAELQKELREQTDKQVEKELDTQLTLKEQTDLVSEIRTWSADEGWQMGAGELIVSERKASEQLLKGETLTAEQQENLETAFDTSKDALNQQLDAEKSAAAEAMADEELKAQEEENALAEQQETEKQAEVERMLSEFVELMVGEKEKADMDRKKEESESSERKDDLLDSVEESVRSGAEVGGGFDLDGVLDVFREDIADFGQNRLVRKIYSSKDVMQKARGMMEYFLSKDMHKQLLQLNMRSTTMLSEDGMHFFAELYGDVYMSKVMTMREITKRFYHYVSILEDGEVNLQIKLSKQVLEANVDNAESVYRQLVGLYHMHKKSDPLTEVMIGGNKKYLDIALIFGKRSELGDIELEVEKE